MRNIIILFLAITTLVGCSKDKDGDQLVDNPYKTKVIGTWELTHFNQIPITSLPEVFNKPTTITFTTSGSYSSEGAFGSESGTYTISGNIVKTYVDNELFISYEIISLKDGIAEAKMIDSSSSIVVKAKKVK